MTEAERIEELEAQVAYYRGELGLTHEQADIDRLRKVFPVTAGEAKFMLTLYRADGRTVTTTILLEACSSIDVDDGVLKTRACTVRRKVGEGVLENVWGRGYRLTPEGIEKVKEVLGLEVAT